MYIHCFPCDPQSIILKMPFSMPKLFWSRPTLCQCMSLVVYVCIKSLHSRRSLRKDVVGIQPSPTSLLEASELVSRFVEIGPYELLFGVPLNSTTSGFSPPPPRPPRALDCTFHLPPPAQQPLQMIMPEEPKAPLPDQQTQSQSQTVGALAALSPRRRTKKTQAAASRPAKVVRAPCL